MPPKQVQTRRIVLLTQKVTARGVTVPKGTVVEMVADVAARAIEKNGRSRPTNPQARMVGAVEWLETPAPVETFDTSGGPAPENRAIAAAPETRDPAAQAKGGKGAKTPPPETESLTPPDDPGGEGEGDGDTPAA